jgi:O-antigen ligase
MHPLQFNEPTPFTRSQQIGLCFLLAAAPMMFGSVYAWAIGIIEVGILLLAAARLLDPARTSLCGGRGACLPLIPLAAWLTLAGASLLPWPAAWLESLAPERYAFWAEAYQALGRPLPAGLPLSLNPAATIHDGLLLLCLLLAAWLTASLVGQNGKRDSVGFAFGLGLTIACLGVLVAVVGLVQKGFGAESIYGFWRSYNPTLFMGPFLNRNYFGNFLAMCLPLLLSMLGLLLLDWTQGRWGRSRLSPDKFTALLLLTSLAMILTLTALGAGLSRGGLICGLGALLVQAPLLFALATRRGPKLGLVGAGLLLLLVLGVAAWLVDWVHLLRRFELGPVEGMTLKLRLELNADTWRMAQEFPWWGSGLGSYEHVFPAFKTTFRTGVFQHAHNDYLEMLAETGWPGLLSYLAFLGWVLLRGGRWIVAAARQSRTWPSRRLRRAILASGAWAGILAFAAHALVAFPLHVPANALMFFVLVGLLLALCRPEASRQPSPEIARRSDGIDDTSSKHRAVMKKASRLSRNSLHPCPAQPAAGKQGVWQATSEGVAKATSRPERGQQHSWAVAGEAGRSASVKYPG